MNIDSFMVNGVLGTTKSYINKKDDRAKKIAKSSSATNNKKHNNDYKESSNFKEKDTGNILDDYV